MKLQDQVCTLNQALMLKTLGISQESAFYRHPCYDELLMAGRLVTKSGSQYKKVSVKHDRASSAAFTVAELGVMLPHPDNLSDIGGFVHPSTFDPSAEEKPWYCIWEYDTDKYGLKRKLIEGNTEAEVRAAMLIYLIQSNVITPAEVNERIKSA